MGNSDFPALIKSSKTDEWYTQPEDVELIKPYLMRGGYKKILCPFDTSESEYVKVLSKDFDVTHSHIVEGVDFFDLDLSDYDAIVSNPPFSKRTEVFEKLFESGKPFAMIMNSNGLFDAHKRFDMFRDNDFELLIPRGRMRFKAADGELKDRPAFQSCYVCRGMLGKQIVFTERNKGE